MMSGIGVSVSLVLVVISALAIASVVERISGKGGFVFWGVYFAVTTFGVMVVLVASVIADNLKEISRKLDK